MTATAKLILFYDKKWYLHSLLEVPFFLRVPSLGAVYRSIRYIVWWTPLDSH